VMRVFKVTCAMFFSKLMSDVMFICVALLFRNHRTTRLLETIIQVLP